MSRYNLTNGSDKFVYGFDGPLSQYFLTKNEKNLVGPLARYGDNTTMITELRNVGILDKIPEPHRKAIVCDIGF